MSKLKFRGKRIDDGTWCYGFPIFMIDPTKEEDTYISAWIHGGVSISPLIKVDIESVTQFIDLKDKNGKEIYVKDIVLGKVIIGTDKEYYSNCYYRVDLNICSGVSLYALKMASDESANQYPTENSPSFKHGSLSTDYRNQNYDRLAFEDVWNNNQHSRKTWQTNHYSNDIEVVGNVFDNPNLLAQNVVSLI